MTKLVFLWHMHQPYYKDTTQNRYLMPWVRLHALKGYYDLPSVMAEHGVRGVINVVPSLLEQLADYAQNGATDSWLEHSEMNPEEMNDEQKAFVLRNFFMLNWERLVETSPRYNELLQKRLRYEKELDWSEIPRLFDNAEILDLQVLFNLKWFGFTARKRYPRLSDFDKKDRGFTLEEKSELLEIQKSLVGEIVPLYKRLFDEKKIEISFTPFYHPIFPLVYDTDIAKRSTDQPLPSRMSYPEDAKWHLREGKRYAEETWSNKLSGMWPAEGSVCPEILGPALEAGVKWLATDEAIIMKSLGESDKTRVIYRPHLLKIDGENRLFGFFRDKYLSDLIGFSFSKMDPVKAVGSFIESVRKIASSLPKNHPEPVVSVVLDGENAWESYPQNGELFLTELFRRLAGCGDIEVTTFGDIVSGLPEDQQKPVAKLFSGSWINGNYEIWIGNREDNLAWEYLKRVRDFYEDYRKNNNVEPYLDEEVMRSLHRAEGSDWFWWYGPQFSTENDWLFDRLFRRNLRRVYNLLDVVYPTFLDLPIMSNETQLHLAMPTNLVTPPVSGKSGFYDWAGCGTLECGRRAGGSMYNSIRLFDRIDFGYDRENLYFRFKFAEKLDFFEAQKYLLKGFLVHDRDISFKLPMVRMECAGFPLHLSRESGYLAEILGAGSASFDGTMTLRLGYRDIGVEPGDEVKVYFKIASAGEIELERAPVNGFIDIKIPDKTDLLKFWDI